MANVLMLHPTLNYAETKNDDFLLNLCTDGNANFLVTGDKDLLILKKIKKTIIITYNQFQKLCQK